MVSRNRKSIVDKWNTFESYDSNQEIQYERCDLGLDTRTWSLNGGGSSERLDKLDNEILIPIKKIIE